MLVERIQIDESAQPKPNTLQETLTPTWRKIFGVAGGKESVFVTGLVQVSSQLLIVVGSTRGVGEAFGGISSSSSSSSSTTMDGFMTKLNPNTGDYIAQQSNAVSSSSKFGSTTKDDWINKACTAPNDETHIYIVGATAGSLVSGHAEPATGNLDAFVAKIDTVTLTAVWIQQFAASPPPTSTSTNTNTNTNTAASSAMAFALDCAVTPDGTLLYVGGVVQDGAVMDNPSAPQKSAGGDDIFLLQVTTDAGTLQWLKQVGTSGEDRMAHGKGVMVDKDGNAIVYGDTTGAFFRPRNADPTPDTTDLFLMTFAKYDGTYQLPTEYSGFENTGGTPQNSANDVTPANPTTDTTTGNTGTPQSPPPSTTATTASTSKSSGKAKFAIFAVLCLLIVFAAIYFVSRARHEKEVTTERAHVFAYLQAFDVEDVDLRHSATGGWHGTYMNKLSRGVNTADLDGSTDFGSSGGSGSSSSDIHRFSFETAPLTHSSIVRDSLFMDVDSKPSLGGVSSLDAEDMDDDHPFASTGSGRGYDGLVGAYNEMDLRPRSYSDRKASLEGGGGSKPWGREII